MLSPKNYCSSPWPAGADGPLSSITSFSLVSRRNPTCKPPLSFFFSFFFVLCPRLAVSPQDPASVFSRSGDPSPWRLLMIRFPLTPDPLCPRLPPVASEDPKSFRVFTGVDSSLSSSCLAPYLPIGGPALLHSSLFSLAQGKAQRLH